MPDSAPIDLDVTDVAHGGVFVGRHEGRVVFVPDAIPGERVRVRPTDTSKPSFWRGEVLEVLEASPDRRPHIWPSADVDIAPERRPGGADFGHIALDAQRALKAHVVADALARFGGVEIPVTVREAPAERDASGATVAEETPDATRWRTRVSLHVDDEGRIGPYASRSHTVVPVGDLPLATAEIERAMTGLSGRAPGRVDLVQPADGRVRVIPRPEAAPRGRRRARRAAPAASGPAREVVVEHAAGRDFLVDAGGFWQVHRLAATALSAAVGDALSAGGSVDPDAAHLDLYGGVGLFAAALATLGGPLTRVTSVESDPRATEHAGENLAEWIGARAETARVDRWITRLAETASATERARLSRGVTLLDPPRAGAGRSVVEGIARLAPQTVVYVACDPVALARDVGLFRGAGYELSHLDALDLFPHSHHVEAIAVLRRADEHDRRDG